uniref:Uncharacterized protein n=1 Tax=Arundo donax TaxID=35708 RepID=A0A0A9FZQ4_ARUDO
MSSLNILVLMLLIHKHRYRMMCLLFGMCLQSFSWQISSRRHRRELSTGFISPNLVFLIHPEFVGRVLDVFVFSPLYKGLPAYLPPPVHVYIWA